ncbi:ATPase subunit of ABC transporter with duplicated ATPase domains [Parabacteroides sp. PFB2-10]|uniref:ABC-F family ATP-binding cassette domain-containing protein n=1 Tax=Parabacteroides sp. PFB2-10 TaxID=1742405 RepID=UPI002472F363|nr:ABC-F family ATP-binding cassette domain-containing protein [Parabacteroides sp. PFB2-10]MDH6311759.1 ATPase subunit of ABC transporter with duplicated ATPase domains [Parabacteroides sp. PFB2-10]
MSIQIQQVAYVHTDNSALFSDINLTINKGEKVSLIGQNGSGKSTLLRMIAGDLLPTSGEIIVSTAPYYIPQHFGQYDHQTVAEALRIHEKLHALHAIENGDASENNFALLDDDWGIEERSLAALAHWGLSHISLAQSFETLSGGEKTKAFLAGLQIHTPEIILFDEPTNHLDAASREQFYRYIQSVNATLLIVSHDRALLNLLPLTYELGHTGITTYGGNYDFYKEQKQLQLEALQESLDEKEKELRLAKKTAREALERKQKHEVRGKKQKIKAGVGKMALDTLQDRAEKSASKLKDTHVEKTRQLTENIDELRKILPDKRTMKVDLNASHLHTGKILVKAQQVNFAYEGADPLFPAPLDFIVKSGERLMLRGNNGSGKTTLLKLIVGRLQPQEGTIERADFDYIYIDQEYAIIRNELTVYEQAEEYNDRHLPEHEIKMLLSRYLFSQASWNKPCAALSGGEKMRLAICCLMIGNQTPDMILLDEPTNNLDIASIEILTSVIRDYQGTIIAVSHDARFLEESGINGKLKMEN